MNKLLVIVVLILLIVCIINSKEGFQPNNDIKAYVINLDESKDRLKLISEQCKRESLKFERLKAVNGRNLDIDNMDIVENKKMDKGAIGCSLSHINLWKKAKANRDKMFIVLEDDCILKSNFKGKLNKLLNEAPKDWDIIYLGGSNLKGKKISKSLMKPVKVSKKSTYNTGTYGMLINSKCVDTLLENNMPIKENIDQNIKNNLYEKLNVYFAVPPCVVHNNNLDSMRRLNSGKSPTTKWFSRVQNKITLL